MTTLLLAIAVVLIGSALCSGTEAVLFSVSYSKVRQWAEEGWKTGAILLEIKENMSRPIATIVVLNNIFNIVGSLIVGAVATAQFGQAVFGILSATLTFLVIIFSEIIPKTLGERHADRLAPILAYPMAVLTKLFFPITFLIEKLVYPLTKGERQLSTDESEIMLLARLGSHHGHIDRGEAEMIANVFRLDDVTAGEIMTPRVSITYVKAAYTLQEAKDDIVRSRHSRVLVVGEDVDEVQGYALRAELLAQVARGKPDEKVEDFRREVQMVPHTIRANELLRRFRERREHIAVVLDEYGGVKGVVTMEDVLEVLTGPIVDETDMVENLQELSRRIARNRARRLRRKQTKT
jgi:CBS domain containing-hemolysin-like protein